MLTQALGWAAAGLLATLALPQVLRLLRTGTTAGVSLVAWQTSVSANLAWTGHGLLTGHPNVWVPNLVFLGLSLMILLQLRRDRALGWVRLLAPAFALGLATVALDVLAGPLAFAVAAFLPSALAQLAQLRSLILAPDIRGVSWPFLGLNVLNQVLWLSWALLAREPSVVLVATALGSLMALNLLWWLLRRVGVARPRLRLLSA